MTLDQCARLSRVWYGGRFSLDWKPYTATDKQELFAEVGLTGDFWKLT